MAPRQNQDTAVQNSQQQMFNFFFLSDLLISKLAEI